MEQLFTDIQKRIAEMFPLVKQRIDEDFGQLDATEEHYPLIFPCVLMTAPEASWRNASANDPALQVGTVQIAVSLCFDCYDDTHYTSTTADLIASRLTSAHELHSLLQGYTPTGCRESLARSYSRAYTKQGGIKIYEQTYSVQYIDRAKSISVQPVAETDSCCMAKN